MINRISRNRCMDAVICLLAVYGFLKKRKPSQPISFLRQPTSKALEHFTYYLRGNLDSLSNKRLISFAKEVCHVKDYHYLEIIRYEEKLNIIWELNVTDFLLPPLLSCLSWKMPCTTVLQLKEAVRSPFAVIKGRRYPNHRSKLGKEPQQK